MKKMRIKRTGEYVAFKEFKHASEQEISDEYTMLVELQHENIIGVKGLVKDKFRLIGYLMEICSQNLSNAVQQNLPLVERMEILYQISCGIEHLHSKGVAHRDLKLDNVLFRRVQGRLIVKICDFGFSADVQNNSVDLRCSPAYAAPELIEAQKMEDEGKTHKLRPEGQLGLDKWAFGVLATELLLGSLAWVNAPWEQLTAENLYKKVVQQRVTPPFTFITNNDLASLVSECVSYDPANRPDFSEIADRLYYDYDY